MKLKFVRPRAIANNFTYPDAAKVSVIDYRDLDKLERQQLLACAGRGSSLSFTVEELFAPGFRKQGGDRSWIAESLEVPFEWWQVELMPGKPLFTVWFYRADCGLVYEAGTTLVCAQAIQFGSAWEFSRPALTDLDRRSAFAAAHIAATHQHPGSCAAQFYPIYGNG